jgi:hypothetical protein
VLGEKEKTMTKITELVEAYKAGKMDFADVIAAVPTLEWGTRHQGEDGEIWITGENKVVDVEVLWFDEIITEEERTAIINAIP